MLAASEFSIGFIGSAEALTLVLPVEKYDQAFLIVPVADGPIAIFLSGEHQFLAFPSSGNESYKGILVPSVSVEMDVTSVDSSSFHCPGAMVRRRDGLFMAARFDRMQEAKLFAVSCDLVVCSRDLAAGFTRWQVTLGTGRDRRELWKVDLRTKTSEAVIGSST
jgi:hypothetical protein